MKSHSRNLFAIDSLRAPYPPSLITGTSEVLVDIRGGLSRRSDTKQGDATLPEPRLDVAPSTANLITPAH
ncbi:unnamed protein product, partial [Iphiclides podalirius]